MNTLPVLILALAAGTSTASKAGQVPPELANLLKDYSAATRYPDAAIEGVLEERRVVVNVDGTSVETHRDVTRILNKRGQEGWSEGSEGYDSTHQTIRLDWARTVLPEGKVIKVAANAIKDTSPFSDYPAYDHYKQKTWSFPATAPGALLDYQVTIHSKRPMLDRDFADRSFFAGFQPARLYKYVVSVPKSRPLRMHSLNLKSWVPVGFSKVDVGDRVEYRWEVENVGYTLSESSMPPVQDFLPSVWLTTAPTWEAVNRWWLKVNTGKGAPSPAIKAKVAEITQGLTGADAKAKAIYEWVVRNVRYVYVDMNYAGYESQDADEVLGSLYGDCKGGSTLMMAMLRAAGIPAHHALVRTTSRGPLVKESPSVYQFNHCIVAAELSGGLTFLDNVGKTVPYGTIPSMDQGALALVVTPEGPRFVEVPMAKPEGNAVLTTRAISLEADGGSSVSVRQTFTGLQDSAHRGDFQSLSPTKTKESFESRVAGEVPNGKLTGFNVTDPEALGTPLKVNYSYKAPEFANRAGNLLIFKVPGYSPDMGGWERETRRFPMWFDQLSAFRNRATLELPAGYHVRYLPPAEAVDLPELKFEAGYRQEGKNLVFESQSVWQVRQISAERYPVVRDLIRKRALFAKELIVLEKN